MSEALIAKLIETRLTRWAERNDVRVAMRNMSFEPDPEETYVKLIDLPAPTTSAFLEGQHKTFLGVYQVSIVSPVGIGAGPGRTLGIALSDDLKVNTILSQSDFKLQIISPVSLGPVIDDTENSRSVQPCSFQYRADTVS